jgi:translation initiation factor 1A
MGKKKVLSEKDLRVLVYPSENDVVGIVQKLLGFDRVLVKCQDGHVRICRIRGKMKRRTWIREGDIVLVSPWDFQSDERGEIFHRYTANQVDDLRRKGILTME